MKPKRSEDNYIQLKKKITDKQIIKVVLELCNERLMTPQQVCYDMLRESALKEINKKRK